MMRHPNWLRASVVGLCGTANALLAIFGTMWMVEQFKLKAPEWHYVTKRAASVIWLLALIWPLWAGWTAPRIATDLRRTRRRNRQRKLADRVP